MKALVTNNQKADAQTLPGKRFNVIFKGLDKCNAACRYCSVGESGGSIIDADKIPRLASELRQLVAAWNIDVLGFTFHGGEPTLLGAQMIKEICETVLSLAPKVIFNMQSNLLELPEEIIQVVEKYNINLGTSIDPLGKDRTSSLGQEMFWRWLRNYFVLAERGNPPGAIYVVTKNSLGNAEQIYSICEVIGDLAGQRFALQLNHLYAQGKAGEEAFVDALSGDEFGSFMLDMWHIWLKNGQSFSLSPIQNFADHFQRDEVSSPVKLVCSFRDDCSKGHVGIDMDLNVATCGRRLDSRVYEGNLDKESLVTLLGASEERAAIAKRSKTLIHHGPCSECSYLQICYGGCPDDASLGDEGLRGRTPMCEGYKKLFQGMEGETVPRPGAPFPQRTRPSNEDEKREVLLATKVTSLPDQPMPKSELWMLPDPSGGWLSFDSGLDLALTHLACRHVRLWVYNHQVPSLMLWEDLLRHPKVSVTLFVAEGLPKALNMLNGLASCINLDVPRIYAHSADGTVMQSVVESLCRDPLWKSQVRPFSTMAQRKLMNSLATLRDINDLTPGYERVRCLDETTEEAELIAREAYSVTTADPATWMRGKRGCMQCRHLRLCGGMLISRDGDGCCDALQAMVDVVAHTAESLAEILPQMTRDEQ